MSDYENPAVNIIVTDSVVTDDVAAVEINVWINESEYYIGKGASRRDPDDKVDHETGYKIALGRAIREVGRGLLREGNERVKYADDFKRQQQAATEAAKARKKDYRPLALTERATA